MRAVLDAQGHFTAMRSLLGSHVQESRLSSVGFAAEQVNVQKSPHRMNSGTAKALPDAQSRTSWLDRACILVPAFDAARSIADVVGQLRLTIPELRESIIVVDDGSRDATAMLARAAGAAVISLVENGGKGAALRAGLEEARRRGMTVALTVDADGQHPAREARRVLLAAEDESALVLGTRDLVRDGAPRANRFSNGISNYFLSRFARRTLHDTQCGLRRYPIAETLSLHARGKGYDFEAEVLLRAVWEGLEVVEEPVNVLYPADRTTHFRTRRDVSKIIGTIVVALGERWMAS